MPGLSGLQLQQKLEILEREIPIIFVTGHGDVDMAVLALKRGAQDFMLKPVDPQRLKGAVFQACQSDLLHFLRSQKEEAKRKKPREKRRAHFLKESEKSLNSWRKVCFINKSLKNSAVRKER